jgi:hypothetical protein
MNCSQEISSFGYYIGQILHASILTNSLREKIQIKNSLQNNCRVSEESFHSNIKYEVYTTMNRNTI